MNKLQTVNHQDQRIVTTQQIAEAYGTSVKHINDNFQNNKDRYTPGKHYFALTGEELRNFKVNNPEIFGDVSRINVLYLWTKKGAFMHAKSLNTDKAWEAYESLVDDYFDRREIREIALQPQTDKQTMRMIASLRHEIREMRQLITSPGETTLHVSRQELEQRVFEAVSNAMPDYPEGICIRDLRIDDPWFAVYGQRYPSDTVFLYAERLVERGLLHREIRGRFGVHYYTVAK